MRLNQVISELGLIPQGRFNGSFVIRVPFTGVVKGQKVKASALASIQYTWDRVEGVDIFSYDVLEISGANVSPVLLQGAAMLAVSKKIEDGSIERAALTHFQNVNRTGRSFGRPRK